MDMTPIDTLAATELGPRTVVAERPLSGAELAVGLAYALFLVPFLIARTFAHLLGQQVRFIGRAVRACAEEVARARRA